MEKYFNSLFNALDATHVYPIRPAHTLECPHSVIHERGRPTRANDDAARTLRAASHTHRRRRIGVAQAVYHALQRDVDVWAARTKVHALWQRRSRHVRRSSRRAGPVYGEAKRERGARRRARTHEWGEDGKERVERIWGRLA